MCSKIRMFRIVNWINYSNNDDQVKWVTDCFIFLIIWFNFFSQELFQPLTIVLHWFKIIHFLNIYLEQLLIQSLFIPMQLKHLPYIYKETKSSFSNKWVCVYILSMLVLIFLLYLRISSTSTWRGRYTDLSLFLYMVYSEAFFTWLILIWVWLFPLFLRRSFRNDGMYRYC